jgi:hypothetical protein
MLTMIRTQQHFHLQRKKQMHNATNIQISQEPLFGVDYDDPDFDNLYFEDYYLDEEDK